MRQKVSLKILIATTSVIVVCMLLISLFSWQLNCKHADEIRESAKQALLGYLSADLSNATPEVLISSVNSIMSKSPYAGVVINSITTSYTSGMNTVLVGSLNSDRGESHHIGYYLSTIPLHDTFSLQGSRLPEALQLANIKTLTMTVDESRLRVQNGEAFAQLLLIEVFLYCVSTLALYLGLLRWVNQPLDSIVRVTQAISSGEQNVRLSITRQDEFGLIMSHVNHLIDTMLAAQFQADTDGLTQLFNHRYLQEKIAEIIARAEKTGDGLTVLLIDLDKFKLLNDTYGHLVGDRFLQHTSSLLRRAVHLDGFVGRYGGDEFLVVLPQSTIEKAQPVMARVREILTEERFSPHPLVDPLPISFSMGLAAYPVNGTNAKELIAFADAALYAEKQGGFNIVEFIRKVESEYAKSERSDDELSRAHGGCFGVLFNLVVAIDKRDAYTKYHSEHVASWAIRLGQAIGLDSETLLVLKLAGLLHDVGKIGVPDHVLRKPGALTAEEYDIMKGHVTLSERLIQEIPYQKDVLAAVSCHHERWDGTGYPRARRGVDMPITGRILGIVDAFSAMSLDRPYRAALSLEVICERLVGGCGTQFDPELVAPFIAELKKVGEPQLIVDLSADDALPSIRQSDHAGELMRAA
jgi:diguanylate cyclase (GGDEF)-like protein